MVKITKRRAKRCPHCSSLETIKHGIRKDVKKPITRYLCKKCRKTFQEKRRERNINEKIFKEYFWKKKTLKELEEVFGLNRKVIQKHIDDYEVKIGKKEVREVGLIIDVVFFNKRKFKSEFGVMVFYDAIKKEPLVWEEVKNEKLEDYKRIYFDLKRRGFSFKYVVTDGKKGLKEFFEEEGLIIQYCQFHQLKTVRNYLSNRPKLRASRFLKEMLSDFIKQDEDEFKKNLKFFLDIFKEEINEKQFNLETKRYEYIHRKLRSAIKSLITNLPKLFTFKKYPELNIPNTTNLLDGGEFSYLKRLLKNHNGISKELKIKMIDEYFENHKNRRKKKEKT